MATKLTLTDLSKVDATVTDELNSNFTAIEDEFDKVLYRDGTAPNTLTATLDANSNEIVNLKAPTNPTSAARLVDITGSSDYGLVGMDTDTVTLTGDFDEGSEVTCHKMGRMVTIQSVESLDHTAGIAGNSGSGDIPEKYRPSEIGLAYKATLWQATEVVNVSIDSLGRVNALHHDFDGTTKSGSSCPTFSISYIVDEAE